MSDNDNRTARERAEELAEEKHPQPVWTDGTVANDMGYSQHLRHGFIDGFLTRDAEPTTVSAEQIEAAAYLHDTYGLTRSDAVDMITDALRALDIRIEGDQP